MKNVCESITYCGNAIIFFPDIAKVCFAVLKTEPSQKKLESLDVITMLNICILSSSLPLSSVTVRLKCLISTGQVEKSYKCSYFKQCCIFDISLLYHVGSYMSGVTLLSRCVEKLNCRCEVIEILKAC